MSWALRDPPRMADQSGTGREEGAMTPTSSRVGRPSQPTLLYVMKQVELAVRAELDELARPAGLTALQYTALTVLERHPDLTSAQLARNSFVTAQAMADMVTALLERELIERHRDEQDRRRLVLALTPRAEAAAPAARSGGGAGGPDALVALRGSCERLRSCLALCRRLCSCPLSRHRFGERISLSKINHQETCTSGCRCDVVVRMSRDLTHADASVPHPHRLSPGTLAAAAIAVFVAQVGPRHPGRTQRPVPAGPRPVLSAS